METTRSAPETAGAVATLALAASGAVVLGVGDAVWTRVPDSDALPAALALLGAALLVWAVVLGACVGAHLVRRALTHRGTSRIEVLLLLAAAGAVAAAVVAHPPFGTGSSAG